MQPSETGLNLFLCGLVVCLQSVYIEQPCDNARQYRARTAAVIPLQTDRLFTFHKKICESFGCWRDERYDPLFRPDRTAHRDTHNKTKRWIIWKANPKNLDLSETKSLSKQNKETKILLTKRELTEFTGNSLWTVLNLEFQPESHKDLGESTRKESI